MTTESRILRQLLESIVNAIYRGDDRNHLLLAADTVEMDVRNLTGESLRVVPACEPCLIGSRPDIELPAVEF